MDIYYKKKYIKYKYKYLHINQEGGDIFSSIKNIFSPEQEITIQPKLEFKQEIMPKIKIPIHVIINDKIKILNNIILQYNKENKENKSLEPLKEISQDTPIKYVKLRINTILEYLYNKFSSVSDNEKKTMKDNIISIDYILNNIEQNCMDKDATIHLLCNNKDDIQPEQKQ